MMRCNACAWNLAALALGVAMGAAPGFSQSGRQAIHSVVGVRHWSSSAGARLAIEVTGPFEYRSDHLHDPERVYFDILNARPRFEGKRLFTEDLDDPIVKRIRAAETLPGVTRIVLDLSGPVDVKATVMKGPDRLMVELHPAAAPAATTPPAPPATPSIAAPRTAALAQMPAAISQVKIAPPAKNLDVPVAPAPASTPPAGAPPAAPARASAPPVETIRPDPPAIEPVKSVAPKAATPKAEPPVIASAADVPATMSPAAAPASSGIPKPAHHTTTGDTSLVRALGLKLQRIVIDPGHGGHDEGTQGPKGLLEKDLVLDVSLRLGKLIEDRMGAEVIYTRSDDTFIPLEGRTDIANEKKADLFLSIHANSSPAPRITGVETYYLNFTDSKEAMEVAARENAGSQESIFELQDLIQKISRHDKASESRDFADRIQTALFAFSSKTFPSERNRGVKKAPFKVLIGAHMPSVLAEIGFISNPREESLLKKPEYRQKLAEALYRGVARYADSLSHFQVAAN